MTKSEDKLETTDSRSDEATTELIAFASKVVGFKPIEKRDVVRVLRDPKNSINNEEEGKKGVSERIL